MCIDRLTKMLCMDIGSYLVTGISCEALHFISTVCALMKIPSEDSTWAVMYKHYNYFGSCFKWMQLIISVLKKNINDLFYFIQKISGYVMFNRDVIYDNRLFINCA